MSGLTEITSYQAEALIICIAASVAWAGVLFFGARAAEGRRGSTTAEKLWIGALFFAVLPSLAAPWLAGFGVSLRPAPEPAVAETLSMVVADFAPRVAEASGPRVEPFDFDKAIGATVVVNHLKSKRGDGGLFGAAQPPVRPTEVQRLCQAEVIGKFAAEILKADPNAALIVLGDMNEHEFRPPMKKLVETSGLSNLHDRIVVADRYTYVWEGNSQVLDHILVSPALLEGAEVDIVHVNAEIPGGQGVE